MEEKLVVVAPTRVDTPMPLEMDMTEEKFLAIIAPVPVAAPIQIQEEKIELPVPVRDLHFMAPKPIIVPPPVPLFIEEKKQTASTTTTPKNSPLPVAPVPEPTSGGLFSSFFRGLKRPRLSTPPLPEVTVTPKSDSEEEYVKMSLEDFHEEKKH